MARTNKVGLDYFPLDVDFFNDEKIEFVSARFGVKGEIVALRLLCKIYRNGYFTPWNDDECTLLSKRAGDGITPSLASEIVKELVKRGFFDESLLLRFEILTSKGIQNRYFEAAKRCSRIDVYSEYLLVDVSKLINVYINPINVYINPINVHINSQSKVKEIEILKEKESLSLSPSLNSRVNEIREIPERERFFEIFFFKNISNPKEELDRFLNHYDGNGWIRSGGQKIKDKFAVARNWDCKGDGKKAFDDEFLTNWRFVYDEVMLRDTNLARLLIYELNGACETADDLKIDGTKKLYDEIKKPENCYFGDIITKYFKNKKIKLKRL
ncbi:MAG: DUF4373 domain-containing protein [Oscillospiraceae bacterium]